MWPRPGWTSSTRRSPRSSEIADENVRSGTTTSVAATSRQRGSSSCRAAGAYLGGVLGQGLGGGLVTDQLGALSLEHAVAERVVPVLVAVDGQEHGQAAHPPQVGDHFAGQRGRRLRVEHQQPGLAGDDRDVDVEPRVARDPDPVGHLVEAWHLAVEASTPWHSGPTSARTGRARGEGGEQMQDDRKLAVLRAIVEDYVATQEPVGSKALVERHSLGVSPATVRNDMAALEEEGFITQPHTSAGRIPTDKGYRLFVDRLTTLKPMSARREARDRHLPRRGGRPRRRGAPLGAAALAADPPGRGRAVPHPVPVHGPSRRAGRAGPDPRCWSC